MDGPESQLEIGNANRTRFEIGQIGTIGNMGITTRNKKGSLSYFNRQLEIGRQSLSFRRDCCPICGKKSELPDDPEHHPVVPPLGR